MSLTGTFEDLSLSSLVQALCLERKRAALVLKRPQETGLIYLQEGDIIHADAGHLNGDKAFFYLFTWDAGEFYTNGFHSAIERTIRRGWQEMLLEGARHKDERALFAAVKLPLDNNITPREREREEQVEENLLGLLAQMEQFLARLTSARRLPATALEILAQMTNQMLSAFEQTMSRTPLSGAASESTRRVLVSQLSPLPTHSQTGLLDVPALPRIFHSVTPQQRAGLFSHLSHQLLNVLSYSYFSLLAACFRSPDLKAELSEAFHVFLADLRQALGQVQA